MGGQPGREGGGSVGWWGPESIQKKGKTTKPDRTETKRSEVRRSRLSKSTHIGEARFQQHNIHILQLLLRNIYIVRALGQLVKYMQIFILYVVEIVLSELAHIFHSLSALIEILELHAIHVCMSTALDHYTLYFKMLDSPQYCLTNQPLLVASADKVKTKLTFAST